MGVLPIDIDAVKAQIKYKLCSRLSESLSSSFCAGRLCKVGRVSPATNGNEHFQFPVLFLEQVELLDAAVGIGTLIIPRVGGVVFIGVSPAVCQVTIKQWSDAGFINFIVHR